MGRYNTPMDRNDWLTLIMKEANRLVSEHETKLREALDGDGSLDAAGGRIDEHVRSVLLDAEDPWDLVRFSHLRDPPAYLWKDADNWPSVVLAVAFACFAHDLARNAAMILRGELPRLDPEKVVFIPKDES